MTLENAPTCVFALITGLLLFNIYLGARKMNKPLTVVASVSATLIVLGTALVVGARNARRWVRL